jgi:hypothetical protein
LKLRTLNVANGKIRNRRIRDAGFESGTREAADREDNQSKCSQSNYSITK